MVAKATQAEVYRTVKLRGRYVDKTWAPWWRAAHQAIYEVAVSTPERFAADWDPKKWLAKQMAHADQLEKDDE
jgi:hypothetical protein